MFQHETKLRVRYSETDQMGFVYYGHYAAYFEVGRVETMRALGYPYKALEAAGVMMPVTEYTIKYFKPGRYDDELSILTSIKEMPQSRIRFYYDTYNEKKEHLNSAHTELVFIDSIKMRPVRIPEFLRAALSPYFQSGI